MKFVSGRGVVRGEGCGGDAVDRVGGWWCTCSSDSYAAAVCLGASWSSGVSESWPDHA
jgi:hypothetical protein